MRGASLLPGLLLLLAAPAWASDWKRTIVTPKVNCADSPPPHRLAYFTDFPDALDYDEDYCLLCSPQQRKAREAAIRNSNDGLRGEVHAIGTVQGFAVFDILYYDGPVDPAKLVWKSIAVRVGPDQYREIYHYQAIFGPGIQRSTIVGDIVASESWLGAKTMMAEAYFWFDQTGPTRLDTQPVLDAAARVLPKDIGVYADSLRGAEAFRSGTFRVHTLGRDSYLWAGGGGEAEVKVAIGKGKIVVTGARYDTGKP